MKRYMASIASSVLVVVGTLFVSVASGWSIHNPKVPQELKRK